MIAVYAARSAAGSYVNRIGKYLNKELDGAYKIKFHPMECEVFVDLLIEIPGDKDSYEELKFSISIVSYQNKLRINIIEISKKEKTVGQLMYKDIDLETMGDFVEIRDKIKKSINKFLQKEYPDYYLVY